MLRRLQDTAGIICGGYTDKECSRGSAEGDGFSSDQLTYQGNRKRSERGRSVATTR